MTEIFAAAAEEYFVDIDARDRTLVGKRLNQIAQEMNKTAVEAALDVIRTLAARVSAYST